MTRVPTDAKDAAKHRFQHGDLRVWLFFGYGFVTASDDPPDPGECVEVIPASFYEQAQERVRELEMRASSLEHGKYGTRHLGDRERRAILRATTAEAQRDAALAKLKGVEDDDEA